MEHYLDSSIIANKLRSLREERGLSRNRLADELSLKCNQDISGEMIRRYELVPKSNDVKHANTSMSVKVLHALAEYFGVSTDYILGRTDIKSPDMSINAIAAFTGLTEESIIYLHQITVGDSEEIFLDNVVAILEHDFIFRSKSDPRTYEMTSKQYEQLYGRTIEDLPEHKRRAQIVAQQERKKYIHGLMDALRKCPVYSLIAINALLSNNNQLHLLEQIGKFISANPEDHNEQYPTYVGQTSLHYTAPQHLTDDTIASLLEWRLNIITEKLEQLREIAVTPTE